MIFAINFTCDRDRELSELMIDTLIKQAPINSLGTIRSIQTGGRDYPDYGNGAGWSASMMKLSEVCRMVNDFEISDTDFILSVDSDVVFTGPQLFEFVNPEYGIIGIEHQQPWNTRFGPWGHVSGCLIFLRGDIVRKMDELTDNELNEIRFNHFKTHDITENEDVVLSYLAMYVGAKSYGLPGDLSGGNFEHDVTHNTTKSFYHLNYCPTEFMGEPIDGKWSIPLILRNKDVTL